MKPDDSGQRSEGGEGVLVGRVNKEGGDRRSTYSSGHNSVSKPSEVSLVAGQRAVVDYPNHGSFGTYEECPATTDQTGEMDTEGDESRLVSVAGLRNRRNFKRLNQSQLARRSGVNQGTISQIEKSGRTSGRKARLLAGALGVRVEELAETEQRSRFPEVSRGSERSERTRVAYSEEGAISCSTDSSPATYREERSPVTVELSEPVLQRLDRFLDLLESALRPRSSGV